MGRIKMFTVCAMVTPFNKQAGIDFNDWSILCARQKNTDAILIGGTTGEGLFLTSKEKAEMAKHAKKHFKGKIIIGINDIDISKIEDLIVKTEDVCDFFLLSMPYYIKLSSDGMEDFIKSVIRITKKQIILYNNPSRSGVDISLDLILKLQKKFKTVIGVKESSTDIKKIRDMHKKTKKFQIFAGNDDMTELFLSYNAYGVIHVGANLVPNFLAEYLKSFKAGRMNQFYKMQKTIMDVVDVLNLGGNPEIVKESMCKMNLCKPYYRMPKHKLDYFINGKIEKMVENFMKNDIS